MREMCGRIFVIGKYKHKKSANKFLENKILYLTFGTEIWLDKGTAADPGRGAAVGIKSSMAVGMAGNERTAMPVEERGYERGVGFMS